MCELLVLSVNKVNADPYLDAKQYKRGDVVCVKPDGWGWGRQELANPLFRIIKVPGVSVSQASGFLGPELDSDPTNPSQMLRPRAFSLDLDAVPGAATSLVDHQRANPIYKAPLSTESLLALKIEKTRLEDPNVFE